MPKSSKGKHETRRANRDRRQRIEEMRKQQRAAERRKNFLFAGSAVVVAIILIGAAVIPAYLHDRAKKAKDKVGYQASPTAAERAAGCLGVHNDPVSPPGVHVANKAIDYSKEKYGDTRGDTLAIPPSGGRHNPVPLGDKSRFYSVASKPRPERAVHNEEHGYVVAWYDSKLPAAEVTKLQALATNPAYSRLLVVGWWQSDLPAGKHVVFTSWGRTDRCSTVSDSMAKNFYADHLNAKLAPEAGAGTLGGEQYAGNDINTSPGATPGETSSPGTMPSATATTNPTPSATTSKKK